MRTAIYVRVAVETPDEDHAMVSQLEALRRYAAENGMAIIEEFADQGYSGLSLDRPGLDRMRDLAQSGGFDVLLTSGADRIARNHALLVLVIEELERFGVKTMFLEGGAIDDPLWRLMRPFTVEESELERVKVAERCRRGKPSRAQCAGIDPAAWTAALLQRWS